MRQILRRNADAGVADGEYAQLSLLMDLQSQRTAVLDELYRVIGQVVHHSVQMVAVAHDGQPFLEVALHIQLFFSIFCSNESRICAVISVKSNGAGLRISSPD